MMMIIIIYWAFEERIKFKWSKRNLQTQVWRMDAIVIHYTMKSNGLWAWPQPASYWWASFPGLHWLWYLQLTTLPKNDKQISGNRKTLPWLFAK